MSSDLFSGLIIDKVKESHTEFYKKYSSINNFVPRTPKELKEIQIKELHRLEGSGDRKYQAANAFIKNANKEKFSHEGRIYSVIEEQIYGRVLNILNAVFVSSPTHAKNVVPAKSGQTKTYKADLYKELSRILKQIGYDKKARKDVLDRFNSILSNYEGEREEYIQFKAKLAEELATHELNKNKNWQAITTGGWTVNKLQIIEDSLAFSKDSYNQLLKNGAMLSMRVTQNGVKQTKNVSTIGEFLDVINGLSGTYSISLDDELYKALQEASILAVQTKSGIDQKILNDAVERNSVKLQDTSFQPILLWHLYNDTSHEYPVGYWFKDPSGQYSQSLNAAANEALSNYIINTVVTKNQVYYTVDGFMTASDYIEKHNYYLRFKKPVTFMDSMFLANSRFINFYKANE